MPNVFVKDSICITCYRLLSNPKIADFLNELNRDLEFGRKVAYARAYYMQETEMIERLGIVGQ